MRGPVRLATGIAALSLAVLTPAGVTPQVPDAQRPTFPAQTELVTVDVVVTDKSGAPVVGLRREDFTVTEDGAAQEIASFEAVHHEAAAASDPARALLRASSNRVPAGEEPASFMIVFDELHLSPIQAVRAREAVASFLETGTSDGDRVAVVGTAEGTRWTSRMPQGKKALLAVVARYQGKRVLESVKDYITPYEAMRIDQERDPIVTDQVMRRFLASGEIRHDVATPRESSDASGEVGSWRSLTQARAAQAYSRNAVLEEQTLGIVERSLEALAAARGRKSLVLVSAGLVQDGRLRGFRRVLTGSLRANAAIYSLDARGLVGAHQGLDAEVGQPADLIDRSTGSWLSETKEASEGSSGLALDSGGFVLENQNDLAAGLARIGAEARSYYLLGYAPTNRASDGRFRKIAVQTARDGLRVRARRGYYAPGRDDKPRPEGRDAAFQRALDAPFDLPDVPLRALAQVFGEAERGTTSVLFTADADIRTLAFAEKSGAARDTLETLLIVADRDTGDFTRFDQQYEMSFQKETRARYERDGFTITRELKLAPGPYQAKLAVRDKNSGRIGSVTHEFEVPAPAGLRVSSLVLSDRLRERDQAQGAPELTARRSFAAAGVLHCRFEVYGAARDAASGQANVSAGFALRRRDGKVVAAAPETPLRPGPDGALARSLGAPLDGVPAGSYEVIVVVTDLVAGRTAEAREGLVIGVAAEN